MSRWTHCSGSQATSGARSCWSKAWRSRLWCAEAIAARLKHAQPGGAAAGAAELRGVVEKMGEFLGAAHQETVKWQEVLGEMERSC